MALTTNRYGNPEICRRRATGGANRTSLTNNPFVDYYSARQPLP